MKIVMLSAVCLWLVFAVSGFASLALEIIWFRALVMFVPATIYAFTMILAVVLAGLRWVGHCGGVWWWVELIGRRRLEQHAGRIRSERGRERIHG